MRLVTGMLSTPVPARVKSMPPGLQHLGACCPGALHCFVRVGRRHWRQCLVAVAPCCVQSGRHLTREQPHCFVTNWWYYIGGGYHCRGTRWQRVTRMASQGSGQLHSILLWASLSRLRQVCLRTHSSPKGGGRDIPSSRPIYPRS